MDYGQAAYRSRHEEEKVAYEVPLVGCHWNHKGAETQRFGMVRDNIKTE
jgi:hypothetical protein